MIRFSCPNCQRVIKAPDDKAGIKAACPQCKAAVTVPLLAAPPLPDLPPLPPIPQQTFVINQGENTSDPFGVVSLILGILAVVSLPVGCCTLGWSFLASGGLAVIGGGLAFLARGNLKTAGLLLNGLSLLPAVIGGLLIMFGLVAGTAGNLIRPAKASPVAIPRDQFFAAVVRKTPDEVIQAIGAPDTKHGSGGISPEGVIISPRWEYRRRTIDPATGTIDRAVTIHFCIEGYVDGVSYSP